MSDILKEIEEIAEKALCLKDVPYKVQKALSEIIVKARTHGTNTIDHSGKE